MKTRSVDPKPFIVLFFLTKHYTRDEMTHWTAFLHLARSVIVTAEKLCHVLVELCLTALHRPDPCAVISIVPKLRSQHVIANKLSDVVDLNDSNDSLKLYYLRF